MNSVFIQPTHISSFRKKEAQFVQVRTSNRGEIFLDSDVNTFENDKTKMVISTKNELSDKPNLIFRNIQRWQVATGGVYYNSPNVNPRNNEIIFFSSVSLVDHTVIVPEGFYTTKIALMNAIRDSLNTVTGASGLTFSYTAVTSHDSMYNLIASGDYFIRGGSMVDKGFPLVNLPTSQTLTSTKMVGQVRLFYTKYIDIVSKTLTQFQKIKSLNNGRNDSTIIYRIFVDDGTFSHAIVNTFFKDENASFNYDPDQEIYEIDFQVLDQFGESLYLPFSEGGGAPGGSGFSWDLSLVVEF